MSQPNGAENLDKFSSWLNAQVQDLLEEALAVCDQTEDGSYLKKLYEVWGRNMGALDAIACLHSVPRELRLTELRSAILAGKTTVLSAHRENCKGCDSSDVLEREITEVH